jgi:hypothetical protein
MFVAVSVLPTYAGMAWHLSIAGRPFMKDEVIRIHCSTAMGVLE